MMLSVATIKTAEPVAGGYREGVDGAHIQR